MGHQSLLEPENEPKEWRPIAPTRPWFGGVWVSVGGFMSIVIAVSARKIPVITVITEERKNNTVS